MFNSITGILTGKEVDTIYVDVHGIEWEILVSTLSLDSFGLVSSNVKVYTWLYHREDQMKLFGFVSIQERALFLDLIKVDGVGPRQALKILSGISATELTKALEDEDLIRIQAAPGVGKKTAQKIILALKGKLTSVGTTQKSIISQSPFEDVIAALVSMGFERKAAFEKVEAIAQKMKDEGSDPHKKEDELFKKAIVALS